jgi:hypothetical protein
VRLRTLRTGALALAALFLLLATLAPTRRIRRAGVSPDIEHHFRGRAVQSRHQLACLPGNGLVGQAALDGRGDDSDVHRFGQHQRITRPCAHGVDVRERVRRRDRAEEVGEFAAEIAPKR